MKTILLILLGFTFTTGAIAAGKKFEYKSVLYTVKDDFEKTLTELGPQGWELASCVTTGSSSYSGSMSSPNDPGGNFTGQIARTSYCVFKREL